MRWIVTTMTRPHILVQRSRVGATAASRGRSVIDHREQLWASGCYNPGAFAFLFDPRRYGPHMCGPYVRVHVSPTTHVSNTAPYNSWHISQYPPAFRRSQFLLPYLLPPVQDQ